MSKLPREKYLGSRTDGIDSSRGNPDNYIECSDCGQSVYMGDLAEVFHHEEEGHEKWLDG